VEDLALPIDQNPRRDVLFEQGVSKAVKRKAFSEAVKQGFFKEMIAGTELHYGAGLVPLLKVAGVTTVGAWVGAFFDSVNDKYIFGGHRTTGYTNTEPSPFINDKGDGHWVNGTVPAAAALIPADTLKINGITIAASADASATAKAAVINDATTGRFDKFGVTANIRLNYRDTSRQCLYLICSKCFAGGYRNGKQRERF